MERRKALTMRLWNKINMHAKRASLFKPGDSILLAVSGGPDSMVMLDYFTKQAQKNRLRIYVAHLNHGIRGSDADKDELFVKRAAASSGLEAITRKINVPAMAKKAGEGIENAARKARYDFLFKTAIRKKCGLIATAHHSDDHAETVMLNLIRGTEPKGLLGIPAKRRIATGTKKTVFVIRPLLCVSRKEIISYAKANGLVSRKDKTNDDQAYTRNWLRKTLIPLIERKQPQFKAHLVEITEKLSGVL